MKGNLLKVKDLAYIFKALVNKKYHSTLSSCSTCNEDHIYVEIHIFPYTNMSRIING